MATMKNRILELVYDKLMDNKFDHDTNIFEIDNVTESEIDYEAGKISFSYNIGNVVYAITLKLQD